MAVEDITTKRCTKCGEHKPLNAFSKDADKRDGLSTRCKPCKSVEHAAWRAKNPDAVKSNYAAWYAKNADKARAYSREYARKHPEQVKATIAASLKARKEKIQEMPSEMRAEIEKHQKERQKVASAKWYQKNAEIARLKTAMWRLMNLDRKKQYRDRYRKEHGHIERAARHKRRTSGQLSRGIVKKLMELQKGKCACCGKPLGDDYHLDHIIPIALGGKNIDNNVQLLRAKCNLQKSKKHPIDFMQERGFLL